MNRRIVGGVIAATVVTALTLTGCTAAEPETGGDAQAPAKISFLTFQSPALSEQFWEDAVGAVLEDFPNLEVEILYTPDLDRQGYANTLLATGTLPDVILDAPTRDFVQAGALLPFDDSVAELFETPLSTIEGKPYALPVGVQVIPQIYYNKTVFDELDLEAPTTYAEFEAAAATIKAAGLTPFLIGGGGADSWTTTMLLNGIINSDVLGADPDWVVKRAAGEVKFTDPEFAAAVEKWVALNNAGYFNADALSTDYGQLQAKFLSGEGVMFPMGTWAAAISGDFEIGVFALPSDSGPTAQGVLVPHSYSVAATSEFPAQAQAFAVAMASSDVMVTAQLLNDALLPVKAGYELPSDLAPLVSETISVWQAEGSVSVDPFGRFLSGERALPSGFAVEYEKSAQNLLTGAVTVEQFLTELDALFDDLNQ